MISQSAKYALRVLGLLAGKSSQWVLAKDIASKTGIPSNYLSKILSQLRQQGLSPTEAIVRGCELRLRPLLMTSMAAFLGLWPMLYASGSGAEIQRPIAAVVMGGLVTALLLTLVVLPAIYYLLETRRDRMTGINQTKEACS